jgi:hypothetical protein
VHSKWLFWWWIFPSLWKPILVKEYSVKKISVWMEKWPERKHIYFILIFKSPRQLPVMWKVAFFFFFHILNIAKFGEHTSGWSPLDITKLRGKTNTNSRCQMIFIRNLHTETTHMHRFIYLCTHFYTYVRVWFCSYS